jgi:protein TonB
MIKNILTVLVFGISLSTCVYGQTNQQADIKDPKADAEIIEEKKDVPYISVEQMPKFIGGDDAMFKYIGQQLVYPEKAKKDGIVGTVFVNFIIDKKGNVTDAEVIRGIKGGEELNAEALRVIKGMPQWEPGFQSGKPASVSLILPVKFVL